MRVEDVQAFRVQLHMQHSGRRRICRVELRRHEEDPTVLASDGYDPDAMDAQFQGRDGEWYDVTNTTTLRRLRAYADELRFGA